LRRFNDWLGDKLANGLSTMACFYIISVAILATLFFQRPVGVQAWLLFWVTVFFQGVALPVLGYVSRKSGERQEQVLNETHDAVMQELAIVKKELELAREERKMLRELLHEIHKQQTRG
jgi:CBS domain containing-hemolysin-like protein